MRRILTIDLDNIGLRGYTTSIYDATPVGTFAQQNTVSSGEDLVFIIESCILADWKTALSTLRSEVEGLALGQMLVKGKICDYSINLPNGIVVFVSNKNLTGLSLPVTTTNREVFRCCYIDGFKLTLIGTTLYGQVTYETYDAPYDFAFFWDKFFVYRSLNGKFADYANRSVNMSIEAALGTTCDAPSVAKAALQNIDSDYICASADGYRLFVNNVRLLDAKVTALGVMSYDELKTVVGYASSSFDSLGAVYHANNQVLSYGVDVDKSIEVHGQVLHPITADGIKYDSVPMCLRIDGGYVNSNADARLSSQELSKLLKVELTQARREMNSCYRTSSSFFDQISLLSENYAKAKNNMLLGAASIQTIMKQIQAIREIQVTCWYNNQFVFFIGDVITVNDKSVIVDEQLARFLFETRCSSAAYGREQCFKMFYGLRGFSPSYTGPESDGQKTYEEQVTIPANYLSNMQINHSLVAAETARRQTYKPWFGDEQVVVHQTFSSTRPKLALNIALTSVQSYLEVLRAKAAAGLAAIQTSLEIMDESMSRYSEVLAKRDVWHKRADMLRDVININSARLVAYQNGFEPCDEEASVHVALAFSSELRAALEQSYEFIELKPGESYDADAKTICKKVDSGAGSESDAEGVSDDQQGDQEMSVVREGVYKAGQRLLVLKEDQIKTTNMILDLGLSQKGNDCFVFVKKVRYINWPTMPEAYAQVAKVSSPISDYIKAFYLVDVPEQKYRDVVLSLVNGSSVILDYNTATAAASMAILKDTYE